MLRHADQKTTAESAWPTNSSETKEITSRKIVIIQTSGPISHVPAHQVPPIRRHSWLPLAQPDQQPRYTAKKAKHTTAGIPLWSPTRVLVCRFGA